MLNDYYEIAINDLEYLQCSVSSNYYNQIAVSCQQISEKMLKSVAELVSTDEKIMKSHNLRQINSALKEVGIDLKLNASDLAYLKDFYFEAMYPGDNFTEVSEDDLNECLDIMYSIIRAVTDFRNSKGLPCKPYTVYKRTYSDYLRKVQSILNKLNSTSDAKEVIKLLPAYELSDSMLEEVIKIILNG